MLELRDLHRRFGDVQALDGVSFEVPPGQLFGFVGRNGAGKITTMRIICGLLRADEGTVRWEGEEIDMERRRSIGYMPEERGLYPKMRVGDQLSYLARLHGLDGAGAHDAVARWLERLGLADRFDDRADQLSLGNQQRVQLPVQVQQHAAASRTRVRITSFTTRREVERALRKDRIDAALVNGSAVIVKTERGNKAARLLQAAARATTVRRSLLTAGLSPERVDRVLSAPQPPVRALDPQSAARDRNKAALIGGLIVLYIALITYGLAVASSVIEEKATRVVELLLVAVRPNALLAGKVLGVGALGLAQLLAVGVAAVGTQALTSASALPEASAEAFALTLLWFLLGYGLYAGAYALTGALVSSQEDVQSASGPITAVLVGSYLVAITAAQDRDGTLASVCAFIPPVAPMVVPTRVVLGHMGPLELALAVVAALVAIAAAIRVAAIAYERAILRTGAPAKLRNVLRQPAA